MLSVQEAQERILTGLKPLETVHIPLEKSLGHTLTEPVYSNSDYPTFDNSSVDGFAVRAEDIKTANPNHPVILKVIADIPAGSSTQIRLARGQAARIMTGALIPLDADAVVMVEDTDVDFSSGSANFSPTVSVLKSVNIGEHIRKKGSDFTENQKILPAEIPLRPQHIGILAMLGISQVPVRRIPRVAILSSGDELVPIYKHLEPGKIHDSNSYMITALSHKAECEVINIGVAADRSDSVREHLQKAADAYPDLIISSAGVSTGAFDYIKDVVMEHGSLDFWKVNMRPGKPLAFGAYQQIPFFGLPGNPVSAFVSFLVFVQPAIDRLNGKLFRSAPLSKAILSDYVESDGRESYLRGYVEFHDGKYFASLTGHQGSGNLFSLVKANALLIIPSGVKSCPPGSEVNFWRLE